MYSVTVYYEDTDSGGVVYYANYLKYFERARTELFGENGLELLGLIGRGIHFVVADVDAKFIKPAHLGDILSVETKIKEICGASITVEYVIGSGRDILVTGKTRMACVNDNFKPIKIPEDILEKIKMLSEK